MNLVGNKLSRAVLGRRISAKPRAQDTVTEGGLGGGGPGPSLAGLQAHGSLVGVKPGLIPRSEGSEGFGAVAQCYSAEC